MSSSTPDNTSHDSFISDEEETSGWLVTFADMMTLLLVFFVLLYSLASFETEKYKSAVEKIKTSIETESKLIGLLELMEIPESMDTRITIEDLTGLRSRKDTLIRDINRFAATGKAEDSITTTILDGKIVVRIRGEALFQSGLAELNQDAYRVLDEITRVLFDYPDYNINIKGHTDDVPISTDAYPSNWELSAIRATNVLKHLIKRGIQPERLTATGYGKIRPLVPNTSEENRSMNRRVEFVLEKKKTPFR
ncbi:MAG: flagellar motor protein MotB [Desulfarculaceae bacterium]|nr:flagellar motor protein MotB [Desulfarculaceae bacterium]